MLNKRQQNRYGRLIELNLAIFLFVLLLTTGSGVFAGSGTTGKIVVNIPEEVEISGPEIRLGEIARISGLVGDRYTELRKASLGRANLPGHTKGISRQHISLVIKQLGYDTADFELQMPPRVKVKTASRILKGEVLLAFARNYLERELAYPPERLKITPRTVPDDLVLPDRDYQLKINPSSGGSNLLNNPYLKFEISIDGKLYKRSFLGFTVELQEEVYVAARKINRGEKLSRDGFKLELRTINKLQGKPLKDFTDKLLTAGQTRIPIPVGAILTDYYLAIPRQQTTAAAPLTSPAKKIIQYGDELEAEVMVGSITVSTRVKARQSGARGEYITVENPRSGRRFKALIVGANLVRVKTD